MSRNMLGVEVPPSSPRKTNATDWERLWRHQPSDVEDDALLERERRSRRWAMIAHHLRATFGSIKGLRTIELGSGRGDLSALLAMRGARVTLFDSSETALDQARRRFDRLGLTACYEPADMLGTLDDYRERFDVALSSGVVEHFRDDDRTRVLRAHYEVLRPGGVAVISVPNAWCVPYRVRKRYLELRGWWPYGMELPYTRRELLRRAKRAGFIRTEAMCMRFPGRLTGRRATASDRPPDAADREDSLAPARRSPLDSVLGLILLLLGWRSS